jgi:hypothetical protein
MAMNYRFRNPHTPLTPAQMELRKMVLKVIEVDPSGFDMGEWEYSELGCETTRCGAGWAQFLARGAVYEYGLFDEDGRQIIPPVDEDAIELLGLTKEEYGTDYSEDKYNALFFTSDSEFIRRMRELVGTTP